MDTVTAFNNQFINVQKLIAMCEITKKIQECKTIAEKREVLKEVSLTLKPLVKMGQIESVNEGLRQIYEEAGHGKLKTIQGWNKAGKKVKKGEKALLFWGRSKTIDISQEGSEPTQRKYFPVSFVFSENQVHENEMKYFKSNISGVKLVREPSPFRKAKITSSEDAAEYCRHFYNEDLTIFESSFIMLLNRSNNVDAFAKISQGGVSGTYIDVKLIAKYAVDTLASGIIMVHNHPTGALKPSPQDIAVTKKIKEAMKWLDVSFLDHLILTEEGFYSFADSGLM